MKIPTIDANMANEISAIMQNPSMMNMITNTLFNPENNGFLASLINPAMSTQSFPADPSLRFQGRIENNANGTPFDYANERTISAESPEGERLLLALDGILDEELNNNN